MAKKIAILTDSSCTLPPAIMEKYHVRRVPLSISIDGKAIEDPATEEETLRILRSGKLSRKNKIITEAPSVHTFEKHMVDAIQDGFNKIIIQTINRMQGKAYANANIAVFNIRRKFGDQAKNISIRVMDSRTILAGQSLLLSETIRCINSSDTNLTEVRRRMENFTSDIQAYVIPREPLTALERSRQRNRKARGWLRAFVGDTLGICPVMAIANDSLDIASVAFGFEKSASQMFAQAIRKIEDGLLSPIITLSYGGPLRELKALPGYAELSYTAKRHNVQLLPSIMSVVGGIYISAGSLSIAMASKGDIWEKSASKNDSTEIDKALVRIENASAY